MKQEKVNEIIEHLNAFAEDELIEYIRNGGDKKKKDYKFKLKEKTFWNVGFDTEDTSDGKVHLLIFSFPKQNFIFYDANRALLWLLSSRFPVDEIYIWCVNTAYDLNNLSWFNRFLIKRFNNKSRFIFGIVKFQPQVKFYDIVNFYSLSAQKVGQLFGLNKLHFDFNKDRKFDKDGNIKVSKKEITYCIRDAKIGRIAGKFMTDKFKKYGIRQTATIASTAYQIYSKHYCPIELFKYNKNRYAIKQEYIYQAYYGGRVEAFRYGKVKGNLKYVDVNSLYPFVMKEFLYPDPFSPVTKGKSADISNGIIKARVKVNDSCYIPPLPVRYKLGRDTKLFFPVGTFEGVWTIQELNNALNTGDVRILKVYWSYEYEDVIDLFSEFVSTMYDKRLKAKKDSDKHMYKIILNSLYGKFSEKRQIDTYVDLIDASPFEQIEYDMAKRIESYYPISNNVIISAYVASYGRILLHNYLLDVVNNGGDVCYCDTDSIIYSGKYDFPAGDKLGQMKLECNINEAEFIGAKTYRYIETNGDEHFVCKGVPKSVQDQIFKYGVAKWKRPLKYQESIRRGLQPNVWVNVEKKLLTKYDKRRIFGSKTKPIIIRCNW